MTNQHGQMSLFFINNSRMSSCGPIYQTFPLRTSIVSEFKVMSSLEVWYIFTLSVLCVKSLRLCPTLCDPMDYNAQGSSVHGILHARVLEWVATSSSSGSSQPRDRTHVTYVSCTGRWVLYHQCHLGSAVTSCLSKMQILGFQNRFMPSEALQWGPCSATVY